MMRRSILTALALPIGALFMVACSTGNGDGPPQPPPPEPIELDVGSDTTAAHDFTLAPRETEYFSFSTDQLTDDLVVIELEGTSEAADFRLDLTETAGGTAVATSIAPELFWSPTGATPAATGALLEPEAIRAGVLPCGGPCVVFRPTGSTEYFEVTNIGDATEEVAIFIYTSLFVDTDEPTNNDPTTPSLYNIGETAAGAIETLGDVDWWQVASLEQPSDTIELIHTGGLELMLYVERPLGTSAHPPGQPVIVNDGDLLRVESTGGLAARGAPSYYYLEPSPSVTSTGGR